MLIIQSILAITLTMVGLCLAFWVFLTNKKSVTHKCLFVLIILSILVISIDYMAVYVDQPLRLLLERVDYGLVPVLVGGLYFFSLNFPNRNKQNIFLTTPVLVYSTIFSMLSIFTNLVISDVTVKDWGIQIIGGKLEFLYEILFVFVLSLILFVMIKKYSDSSKTDKQRIRFFLFGLVIWVTLEAAFIIILPMFGLDKYSYLGDYSIIFFFGLTSYAIIKHRLMDVRMVVARSVAFMILIATIGLFYTFSMIWMERIIFPETGGNLSPGQIIFRIALTLFVVFTFQPLKKFITIKTDKIFFKQSYNPEKLLDTLSHTMGSSIVLIELMYKVLNILISDMKVSRGFFVLLKDGSEIYTTQGIGYKKSPKVKIHDIEFLTEDGIVIYDELEEGSKKKYLLHRFDATIAIPIKMDKEVSGILLLGEKSSGDMYSVQDLRILEIIAPEVSVAIENAKSYEEIQHFNAILRAEVQKATHDLETANQNLRELDKAKDEFISMASHQLRTPLTAIKGYLSMLLEGDAGEIKMGQYDFIKESFYGATRMVALINDLLNVSRMETGRFFLDLTDFDLNLVVDEEIKQLKKPLEDRGLRVTFDKAQKSKMHADELKVRQVVMNFIDNAIYYSLEGRIKVRTYEEGENICFEVSDNGIGVPKEQQEHLFTKFYRAENARRTRPDGTGLGLFMAKRVINEHSGEIIFHSKEGEGSTFGFKIPLNVKPKGKTAPVFGETVPADTKVSDVTVAADEEIKKDVATAGIEVKEPVEAGK